MRSKTMPDSTIDAMPTKRLFIEMLTKDIPLIPAIIDLIDNAADSARQLRKGGSLSNVAVHVTYGSDFFSISDNCAGIPIDVAEKYAFRFGRAHGAPSLKHSVGQFGVGMKRAIFKMGRAFTVESATSNSRFVVSEDVDDWAKHQDWHFRFAEREEGVAITSDRRGTRIKITRLHSDVADSFALASFENELRAEIQSRLQEPLSRGLVISVNQVPVQVVPMKVLADPRLAPAEVKFRYPDKGSRAVTVRLICGLGPSDDRAAAGWHVYCNGRLILEGDKSDVTGWGENYGGIKIPGFHAQYNHLRGFAFFDCDDPSKLPWNTTKTGVDVDSAVYRAAKLEMMKLMLPVKEFLDLLKKETEAVPKGDSGPLKKIILKSRASPLSAVRTRETFVPPKAAVRLTKNHDMQQTITYQRPTSQVEKVKRELGVKSPIKVGERTFDYYYRAEIE